jgi:hypothetical protein
MCDKEENDKEPGTRPEADNRIQEKLDQYLADTFPCSDPLPQPLLAESFSCSQG